MKTRIFRPTPVNLQRLASQLRNGQVVGVPAETVYGLAADALNADACQEIFRVKERPAHDPLIVHVANRTMARTVCQWNDWADSLAKAFWPGPLTLVLPKSPLVPAIVTSGKPTVAVRLPAHPLFRALIEETGRPLAAPSANPFGYISPTSAQHVKDNLTGRIASILDGGACPIGLESTIIDLSSIPQVRLLRPGAIARSLLEEQLGKPLEAPVGHTQGSVKPSPDAPGMLEQHYSPRTPTFLHSKLESHPSPRNAWVYYCASDCPKPRQKNHYALSPAGEGEIAARNLYGLLRKLDNADYKEIHLEAAPSGNPWAEALNDRMKRAAFSTG